MLAAASLAISVESRCAYRPKKSCGSAGWPYEEVPGKQEWGHHRQQAEYHVEGYEMVSVPVVSLGCSA